MPGAGVPLLLEAVIRRKTHPSGRARLPIIEDLRLSLPRGQVTCLLGPSGCGKTTALRIVMGLDRDFEGHVSPPVASLRLGVVFQDARLLPWRSVEQNVRLAAPTLSASALGALLDELGLGPWRSHRPLQLSGGMARRVALARALAVDPDLLVLDEAFVSLDERNAEALRDAVFGAVERRRTTVLMVTHNVREALAFSDRVLLLAPRPTHVLETMELDRPRDLRDEAWFADTRERLAATNQEFLTLA